MIGDIHVGVFYVLLALILTLIVSSFVLRLQHASDFLCTTTDCVLPPDAGQNYLVLLANNPGVEAATEMTYLQIAMNLSVAILAVGVTLILFDGSQSALGTVNLTLFYVIVALGLAFMIAGFVSAMSMHSDGRRLVLSGGEEEDVEKVVKDRRATLWYQNALIPVTITGISLALVISMAPLMKT